MHSKRAPKTIANQFFILIPSSSVFPSFSNAVKRIPDPGPSFEGDKSRFTPSLTLFAVLAVRTGILSERRNFQCGMNVGKRLRGCCPHPRPLPGQRLSIFSVFPQSRARQCSTFLLARAPRSRKSTASGQGEGSRMGRHLVSIFLL